METERRRAGDWWSNPWLLTAVVLATAIPLLWPTVPPLVDLPGHMGRYHVQLNLADDPNLQRWYAFEWALIGNLGLDLIVQLLGPVLGIEPTVKLVMILIPPMTAAGFLWVAREVHGRLPPTAFLAVPLVYNFPFLFGFANFALSMALAMLAFGLWLHLARAGRLRLRAVLFVPLSMAIWVAHAFGWGTLGVLAFSAELVRQHDLKRGWASTLWRTGIGVLPLAPPVLLMLLWRGDGAGGFTGDWFNWRAKLLWVRMILRDRWESADVPALLLLIAAFIWARLDRRLRISRNLLISATFLLAVYLLLPRIVFGSAYADMRLAPFMLAVAIIAVRLDPRATARFATVTAAAALIFVGARLATNTWSFLLYERSFARALAGLELVPRGATLVTLIGKPCRDPWAKSRLDHVAGLALVRRGAFANDQWEAAGAQLLRVRFDEARPFVADPSQLVVSRRCGREVWLPIGIALPAIRRDLFDYVWMVEVPGFDPALVEGMTPMWRDGNNMLWRIER